MGRPQRRKGTLGKNKAFHKRNKAKHYRKDMDLIYDDNKPENAEKFMNQPLNENLPGFGQFLCLPCSRHFINKTALETHLKTKWHKKQIKQLKEVPYSIKESQEYGK